MMTMDVPACPASEMVGAFVEGRSGAEERAEMIRHLDRCEPCRQEVAMLAEFAAAGTTNAQREPGRATRSGWWLAAAASLVTVAGVGLWRQGRTVDRDGLPVAPLVAATAPLGYRVVEPRLSVKIGWARYHGPVRSSAESRDDPKVLNLNGAAAKVLMAADANPSAEQTHAAAIARLMLEDPARAIEALTKVTAERPNDARAWSDLAAAHDAAWRIYGRASELSPALVAAERAIRLDPKLAEAYFNRALIVEHLGMNFEAREAWMKYLELDPSSEWAREARENLEKVSRPSEKSQFDAATPRLELDATAGNLAAVRAVADRFPQRSRELVEIHLLGRWSEAFRAGNTSEAERALAIARTIGAALRGRGEALPAAMVASIDGAPPAARTQLAAAFASYHKGRLALTSSQSAKGREAMLEAARLFGDAPGALSARHFAAVGSEQLNRPEIAARELNDVLAITPANWKAQRAQIEWDLGIVHGRLLHYGESIAHLQTAAALFGELGESGNRAWMQWMTAEVWTLLGRRDEAWQSWVPALPAISEISIRRLSSCLNGMSKMELLSGYPDAARSLAEIGLRHGAKEGTIRAELLNRVALLHARTGEHASAVTSLVEGQSVTARLTDQKVREQETVDFDFAEGVIYATSDPSRALAALTRVETAHRNGFRPMLLPATLYERACILRALRRDDEAQRDFMSAIASVESQRTPVEWRDTKSGALDGVDPIYHELAELLLERDRAREAFNVIDRAAAFAFYGAAATASMNTLDALQQQLPPGSLVIEYLVRPAKTSIFVIGPRTFDVRTVDVASTEVTRLAGALDSALRPSTPVAAVDQASAALEKTLLGPVRDLLIGANELTFILDPLIASIPLAMLADPSSGRRLVEDHTIRIAASALYRDPAKHEPSTSVVVIRPSGGVSLPQAEAEVALIQRLYPRTALLQGDATTKASVVAAMRDAGLIHYAGHAGGESEAGLILRAGERPELLRGDDIMGTPLRAAPLVVLAGCRTMRGGARRADLATSLARAFLIAGARSVVGTSWNVEDDDASTFFLRFHELNSATGNPVTALAEAQRLMLHDPRRHPAEWAFAQIVVRSINP